MSYQIKLEQFSGPFDLLLNLIEEKKLDITQISLAKVTDDFLSYLEKNKELDLSELADFLVVAAKLLLIKSSLLLSQPSETEIDSQNLEKQLKIYREYYQAAKIISKIFNQKKIALARQRPHSSIEIKKFTKIKIKPLILKEVFNNAIRYLLEIQQIPQRTIKKVISLQEMINKILQKFEQFSKISFKNLIKDQSKIEVVVSFLAILELAKQGVILIEQKELFREIIIKKL